MTCPTLLLRRNALLLVDSPVPIQLITSTATSLRQRLTGNSTFAQLTRFAVVGLLSSLLYAAVFVSLGPLGDLVANLLGMVASTMLANELHRRLTFHATADVGWLRAQLQGGGLAVVGLTITSLALLGLESVVPGASWLVQVLMVGAITGGIGLVRFAALRAWVFTAARRTRMPVRVLAPR